MSSNEIAFWFSAGFNPLDSADWAAMSSSGLNYDDVLNMPEVTS